MADVIVFVHGTGVRGQSWGETFAVVEERVGALGPDLKGCFWGEQQGAELRADGASIPDYDETGGEDPSEEEEALALWSVLYTDPWYELRLLGDWPAQGGPRAPGRQPPGAVLTQQVAALAPSDLLAGRLDRHGLRPAWDRALAELRASPEFGRAAQATSQPTLNVMRRAIARSLTAHALAAAEEAGAAPLAGADRDEIVAAATQDLQGVGFGVVGWLTRPFKGVAGRVLTRRAARKRGAITDASYPAAGDIIRYQARGDGIRDAIRQFVADTVARDPDPSVMLLAHSLGGIACVDALIEARIPHVARLVTVGSQAPFFYEIDALTCLRYGASLPDHFPPWLNVYDRRDFLSYVGEQLFPGRVVDREVDNGQPFPQAHSAYWRNDEVWQAIGGFLA